MARSISVLIVSNMMATEQELPHLGPEKLAFLHMKLTENPILPPRHSLQINSRNLLQLPNDSSVYSGATVGRTMPQVLGSKKKFTCLRF